MGLLTGCGEKAEDTAHAALAIEARDGWSVHAMAHVLEMQNRYDEGEKSRSSLNAIPFFDKQGNKEKVISAKNPRGIIF